MPITINGIGTRYYGHRNLASSVDTCEFCQQRATLSNYNTTHWFVVFYLPIIPLGKKQIFSDCSLCRKHRMLSLAEWERIQSKAIDEARAAADAAPRDPAAAINLLGVLYSCFRRDEAAELARELHDRFPQDAGAQLAAADCLQLCGAPAEAERAYLTALELDHDNLRAKRAVALSRLQKNDPDTADRLISSAPRIEPAHDPRLFVQLGEAFAAQGRHDQALAAFQGALAAAPALGGEPRFRRSMKAAEQASGAQQSSLPQLSWLRRYGALLAVALILLIAGLPIAWYQYAANHHTLHIVNGFNMPLSVRLDDGSQVTVPALGHTTTSIAEGQHEATVSAGNRQLQGGRFDISASVVEHFHNSPVFVLNPGCGATMLFERAIYVPAARPGFGPGAPSPPTYILGRLFQAFPDVDFVFREFPRRMEVKNGFATKTRVIMAPQDVSMIVEAPPDVASAEDRLRLAETHLRVTPDDVNIRRAYLMASDQAGQRKRAEKFLLGLAIMPPQ